MKFGKVIVSERQFFLELRKAQHLSKLVLLPELVMSAVCRVSAVEV